MKTKGQVEKVEKPETIGPVPFGAIGGEAGAAVTSISAEGPIPSSSTTY
jgi:hypothetical protein